MKTLMVAMLVMLSTVAGAKEVTPRMAKAIEVRDEARRNVQAAQVALAKARAALAQANAAVAITKADEAGSK